MAVTFISEPKDFTPGFNPVVFIVDSDNKAENSFRYVVDIYKSATSEKIHESRVPPRVGDGYGFIPVEKIVQSYMSSTLDLTATTSVDGSGSFFAFDIKIGEEYVEAWSYDDFEFRTGNKTAFNSTTVHAFSVGDQISVQQTDGGVEKPILQGLHTVVDVPNSTEVIIELPFSLVGAGATMGGVVGFADNRTLITRDLAEDTKVVFDGAIPFVEFNGYDDSVYKLKLNSTTNRLLTTLPDTFYMSPDSLMFLNYGQADSSKVNVAKFQNDAGTVYSKSVVGLTPKWVRQYAAGAGNIGSGTIVLEDTKYYDTWLADSSGNQVTKKYRVFIDDRCELMDVRVLFKDRMGSFIPFSFSLRVQEVQEVTRTSIKKSLKGIPGSTYGYSLTDGGVVTTSVLVDETYTITTNWLNDAMAVYLKELISSPVVLVRLDDVWMSCQVQDTSYPVVRSRDKTMIKKTLSLKLSNQDNVNV